jgi:hypothetical protein
VPKNKALAEWTKEEVQAWFSSLPEVEKKCAPRFPVPGKSLAAYTEAQFLQILGARKKLAGTTLYNAVQELKKSQGMCTSDYCETNGCF